VRAALSLALCLLLATSAQAQPPSVALDASRHFQRGVDLYGEGDFRGALVEFEKAYSLLPRATVLYDIGQTQYQLQEYAKALRTLERFLAETGPSAAHRDEVEKTVIVLRGRVGRVAISADRADCEVRLDGAIVGNTPLRQPVLASIGRRVVSVACPDRQHAERDVDVAAEETVAVELKIPAPAAAVVAPAISPPPKRRSALPAWIVTGVLAGATAGLYTAALLESKQLSDLRATYPVARDRLDDKSTLVSRLALAGDIVAAATVVSAGVATFLTLSPGEERVRVGLGLAVRGAF
jgi:tetratricopeptide (TPR) repeat protein